MANAVFNVEITHFEDDGVWVATSADIKGLTVEANTLRSVHRGADRSQLRVAGAQSWANRDTDRRCDIARGAIAPRPQ